MATIIKHEADCVVAGGGPAGVMLGFLLARAGVDVIVMEKHADFFRDFRGDTIHPSTLQLMHELGLLDAFLKLPHQEAHHFSLDLAGTIIGADFTDLPTVCKYIALMPQWDFLNFLAEQGKRYPGFRLMMNTEVTDLIEEDDRVTGVRATGPDGAVEARAPLVAGTDGRHSTTRERAGFEVESLGAPMDVLWMRLPRKADEADEPALIAAAGRILVLINRGDYWQCAYVIPKGGYDDLKAKGLAAFRSELAAIAPFPADRIDALKDWDQIKLLTVAVDRLRQWYRPGLLCIGDAAHAMSPIGGVGVNLAVQDAVATANLLAAPLKAGSLQLPDLQAVQERREFPARMTQRFQILAQDNIIRQALDKTTEFHAPLLARIGGRIPTVQRLMGRLVGMGVRPEHIHTPDVLAAAAPAK
ncbi:MAG: FAD-dependent oxidoreductase [Bauldia sp.]|nr:FAD-dependent oxidoreductase [Bauldia sp.]